MISVRYPGIVATVERKLKQSMLHEKREMLVERTYKV
jgi:hypothetical protein